MVERKRVIVEMDAGDVPDFKSIVSKFPRYKILEPGSATTLGIPRPESHFRPVEEMNWEEELLELQTLHADVLNAQKEEDPQASRAFDKMFGSWQEALQRFGVGQMSPEILKDLIIKKMADSVTKYATFTGRPGSYRKDIGFVYRVFIPDFSPRELRAGILYFGLDGKEALKAALIGEKESIRFPRQVIDHFTYRNMWNFKRILS